MCTTTGCVPAATAWFRENRQASRSSNALLLPVILAGMLMEMTVNTEYLQRGIQRVNKIVKNGSEKTDSRDK
jgi:hypothetical protein